MNKIFVNVLIVRVLARVFFPFGYLLCVFGNVALYLLDCFKHFSRDRGINVVEPVVGPILEYLTSLKNKLYSMC